VQVSSQKATVKIDEDTEKRITSALQAAGIANTGIQRDAATIKVRFATPDVQLQARDALEKALNPDRNDPTYITALNLLSSSPSWLTRLRALPMYLGLDLRGGVHFLMQVDTAAAVSKRVETTVADFRSLLRDRNIRHAGIVKAGPAVEVAFRDEETREQGPHRIGRQPVRSAPGRPGQKATTCELVATLKPEAIKRIQELASSRT
jgi:preprotein translocase subunit SecD